MNVSIWEIRKNWKYDLSCNFNYHAVCCKLKIYYTYFIYHIIIMSDWINTTYLSVLQDVITRLHDNPIKIFNLPKQEDTFIEVDMEDLWTIPPAMRFVFSHLFPGTQNTRCYMRFVFNPSKITFWGGHTMVSAVDW